MPKKKKSKAHLPEEDEEELPPIPPIHNVLIDLRTITAEEEERLLQVIEKDEAETRALDHSVGVLRHEIELIRSWAVKAKKDPKNPHNLAYTCARCRRPLQIWKQPIPFVDSGKFCMRCKFRVCNVCRVKQSNGKYMCILCVRYRQEKHLTGDWADKGCAGLHSTDLLKISLQSKELFGRPEMEPESRGFLPRVKSIMGAPNVGKKSLVDLKNKVSSKVLKKASKDEPAEKEAKKAKGQDKESKKKEKKKADKGDKKDKADKGKKDKKDKKKEKAQKDKVDKKKGKEKGKDKKKDKKKGGKDKKKGKKDKKDKKKGGKDKKDKKKGGKDKKKGKDKKDKKKKGGKDKGKKDKKDKKKSKKDKSKNADKNVSKVFTSEDSNAIPAKPTVVVDRRHTVIHSSSHVGSEEEASAFTDRIISADELQRYRTLSQKLNQAGDPICFKNRLDMLNQRLISQDRCREFISHLPESGVADHPGGDFEEFSPYERIKAKTILSDILSYNKNLPNYVLKNMLPEMDNSVHSLKKASATHPVLVSKYYNDDLQGSNDFKQPAHSRKVSRLRSLLTKHKKKLKHEETDHQQGDHNRPFSLDRGHFITVPSKYLIKHDISETSYKHDLSYPPKGDVMNQKGDLLEKFLTQGRKLGESFSGHDFQEMRNEYSRKMRYGGNAPENNVPSSNNKEILNYLRHRKMQRDASKYSCPQLLNEKGKVPRKSCHTRHPHLKDTGSSGDSNLGLQSDRLYSISKTTSVTQESSMSKMTGHLKDHVTFCRGSADEVNENTSFSKHMRTKLKLQDKNYSFQPRTKEQKETETKPKEKDKDKDKDKNKDPAAGAADADLKKKKSTEGDTGHRKRHHGHRRHRGDSGSRGSRSKSRLSQADVDFSSVMDVVRKRADELSQSENPVPGVPDASLPPSPVMKPSSRQHSLANLPKTSVLRNRFLYLPWVESEFCAVYKSFKTVKSSVEKWLETAYPVEVKTGGKRFKELMITAVQQ
ncbi:hypothetical protein Btru_076100 [Bulinus truncatus]|nr:hypothetical protein Btru_076100 [Bulinus truncatus]